MQDFYVFLHELPRSFPMGFWFSSVGYMRHRKSLYRGEFEAYSFMIILRGSGFFGTPHGRFEVRAPALLIGRPGADYDFGPQAEWEEAFACVRPQHVAALMARGLLRDDEHAFPIHDAPSVFSHVRELIALAHRPETPAWTDQIDRSAERMVVAALTSARSRVGTGIDTEIDRIRAKVEARLATDIDFEALAKKHGLSLPTFRRHWLSRVGTPPAKHVANLRIQLASRLLVETELPIARIARRAGFRDARYFSRKFAEIAGVPASEYRRRFKRERPG